MNRELTAKDIKTLKFGKRIGYVFAALTLCFGALLNLAYFLLIKREPNYLLIGIINVGVIALAYFICNRVNHKINLDLKWNKKELLKRTVLEKQEEFCSEPGSGMLYIPILGDLFPKLWGQKMKMTKRYFIIANEYRYEVAEEVYTNFETGTEFYVHFAKNSGTILDLSKEI